MLARQVIVIQLMIILFVIETEYEKCLPVFCIIIDYPVIKASGNRVRSKHELDGETSHEIFRRPPNLLSHKLD